ncbi:hypothetical protein Pcinc_002082 [Petrolisthes cinctipes]|uniref:C2H2-type domain-containing protein n=1 Tax=Petrolisthes cinctipes TaxID=88211 RepID=A0AAE1L2K9_PETCI|nr:hypothetical protein Pcinc_022301 [Petrolisthes cinctipes]KAK3894141.1 hypothetical protein Pcinc_002082 [Petrolisthes cinctipes]
MSGGGGTALGTSLGGSQYPIEAVRVPDDYRRFICPLCPYKTPRKDLLEGHVRTHTGDKPFSCPFCPYQSADRSNLRRHRLKNHPDPNKHSNHQSQPSSQPWHF